MDKIIDSVRIGKYSPTDTRLVFDLNIPELLTSMDETSINMFGKKEKPGKIRAISTY